MDFYDVLTEYRLGEAYNPYAAKSVDGWIAGTISIDFLNKHFGEFDNTTDMINKAEKNGMHATVLYFQWLVDNGKLTM